MTRLGLHPGMSDAMLCQILLDKGTLTDNQLTDIVAAAARVAAGKHLLKNERDRMMAIMMAQGLAKKTMIKRKPGAPNPINVNGDMFSTVATAGTKIAEQILAKGRTPSGKMLVPPSRRRTG